MSSSLAGNGFDIGIEAEDGDHEGALPSLVTIAWENSDDIKSIANFFTLRRGAVAISEAQCITHKVRVTLFISAPTFKLLMYDLCKFQFLTFEILTSKKLFCRFNFQT